MKDGRNRQQNQDLGRSHKRLREKIIYQESHLNHELKGYYIWSLMDTLEWERVEMTHAGKWLSEFLDLKDSLHKCYFEGHHEKGYAPKLFDTLNIWILIIGV
ncbi:hypothetical protein HID58_002240 [Brassica napus]|uniref:Thioglucosidase n=1 Tax=Brassica napus TaxID=3708 RepID=A0ABQ8EM74_BRANA|nr:hypothetical protein HID58_002240 [Brassica napus]